ncbi:ribonuclease H [Halarcobacter mediterraneus]|uniref:Ribonuclease H n=1 Tax=Halarcobacter mediterraneus TaxID=2023153 RepID=A0A4Q1AV92_9BACT|nr:RNase H family protein [Halarcobacter mediterraneus]RXK14094.1 ribonuclease H [Halarcobacter mediterraneus]
MEKIKKVFVDGSVNPQKKIGIGAFYLYDELNKFNEEDINTKRFENTSSTKLELECLLWALKTIDSKDKLLIYTDCQNIFSLLNREEKLKKNNYFTSTNKKIKNHLLYEEFFYLNEIYDLEFIKVKGHKKSSEKDEIDLIFSKVDKKARKELRNITLDTILK